MADKGGVRRRSFKGCGGPWQWLMKKGTLIMKTQTGAQSAAMPPGSHELRFASAYQPGRGIAVPCDERGEVDLDALPERLRIAYLGARALVGREYLCPTVQRVH